MLSTNYESFLLEKQFSDVSAGFDIAPSNKYLFAFQEVITRWALRRGRAAIFANTGLGKTIMQGAWADEVNRHTGYRVLILAPLCVAQQTVEELRKFGIHVHYARKEEDTGSNQIIITNYEMMDHFSMADYGGIVLDESSILKHQQSKTRERIIYACQRVPYRLTCTATPSPNDFMELGNQAEFLGIMSASEMLSMFFTHDGGDTSKWRLKKHGQHKFWEWMSSWAVVLRMPSDLGFPDDGYILPGINTLEHIVDNIPDDGQLFRSVAGTLQERRAIQRETIENRAKIISNVVNASTEQWVIWCHLNDESKTLDKLIPDAMQVSGSDKIETKEQRLMDFSHGETSRFNNKTAYWWIRYELAKLP